MQQPRKLKDLKLGEFFTRKIIDNPKESQVFIRCAYDRQTGKYPCQRYSDINDTVNLSGDAMVYTEFNF